MILLHSDCKTSVLKSLFDPRWRYFAFPVTIFRYIQLNFSKVSVNSDAELFFPSKQL